MANEPQAPLLSEEEPLSAEELEWFSLRARKHSQHPHLNAEWKQALRDMLRAIATIGYLKDRNSALASKDEAAARCKDPQWDGTDGACPAWWRGNDRGYQAALARVKELEAGLRCDKEAKEDGLL